jgi:hypothetical protein
MECGKLLTRFALLGALVTMFLNRRVVKIRRSKGSSDEHPAEDLERSVNWSRDTSNSQLKEGVGNIV